MLSKYIRDKNFHSYIEKLKKEEGLKIVDAHFHPFDVFSIKYRDSSSKNRREFKDKLIRNIRFGRNIPLNLKASGKVNMSRLFKVLKGKDLSLKELEVLDEMDNSYVDYSVFLPVASVVKTNLIKRGFPNKRFFHLDSVDLENIDLAEMEAKISRNIKKMGIVGIHLHPNIQNFHPLPKENSLEIREKLDRLCDIANKNHLYIHYHVGKQIDNWQNRMRYGVKNKRLGLGILANFCDSKGKSELFDQIETPIILSHLGSANMKLNIPLIKKVVDNYDNVYFDTANATAEELKMFLDQIGSDRLIFGSNALYDGVLPNIYEVYKAVNMSKGFESRSHIIMNILGGNYLGDVVSVV